MSIPDYPLHQLELIKQKRLEEAEKLLKAKKFALEEENKKQIKLEKARDVVKVHKGEKLDQMDEAFDYGTNSDEIEVMERYLKVVDERLKAKEDKVEAQKKAVTAAEEAVEEAKKDLYKKQQDIEKIDMHKKEWKKEVQMEMQRLQGVETDEIGSVIHTRKKR